MPRRLPLSWILVLVVIAAIIVAILLTSPGPAVAPSSPEDIEPTPSEENFQGMLRVGPNAIYVDAQLAGSNEVIVGMAVLGEPGFVVIHSDDGGVPGKVIGASERLSEGGENIRVNVDETLEVGRVYYAMLHADANQNGVFDGESERPLTDTLGNVILMSFEATTDANPGESIISI